MSLQRDLSCRLSDVYFMLVIVEYIKNGFNKNMQLPYSLPSSFKLKDAGLTRGCRCIALRLIRDTGLSAGVAFGSYSACARMFNISLPSF